MGCGMTTKKLKLAATQCTIVPVVYQQTLCNKGVSVIQFMGTSVTILVNENYSTPIFIGLQFFSQEYEDS